MSIKKAFTRIDFVILLTILCVAFAFRLYKIDNPVADWHSWRQADTAAVARNLVEGNFDLMRPRYDDLSNVQTGQYNPQGYRMVEFPIYNAMFAGLYKLAPVISLEMYGRLTTALLSLLIISVIYILLAYEAGRIPAIFASGVYAIFPFFVYYSRVILPETPALAAISVSILALYFWARSHNKVAQMFLWTLSLVCAAMSLLIKPTVIFYFIVLGIIFLKKYRTRIFLKPWGYVFAILAVLPFIGWRIWIQNYPEGIASFEWLLTTVNTAAGPQIIFMKPSFFRWVFYERILLLISGGWAGAFIIFGIAKDSKKTGLILLSMGASALAYLLVFQGGNVQHDYYQTLILPAVAIFIGLGIGTLYEAKNTFLHQIPLTVIVLITLGFSWLMSANTVKDYYLYSEQLLSTAHIIDTITPKDALVVTDNTGDTTLLYNAHRKGMPAVTEPLQDLKKRGVDYFVTNNGVVGEKVQVEYKGKFELIFQNNGVYIFKL